MSAIDKGTVAVVRAKTGRHLMTDVQFNKWVEDVTSNALKFLDDDKYVYGCNGGTTYIVNTKTKATSFSNCSKDDVFDPNIGLSTAFARYMNMPLPIAVKIATYGDLVTGDMIVLRDGTIRKFCGLFSYNNITYPMFFNTNNSKYIDESTIEVNVNDIAYKVIFM